MNTRQRLQRILARPHNVRFQELVRVAEGFGFELRRVAGSHHIYGHGDLHEQVNLQSVGGKAKPYQIRQLLSLVERYNLRARDE